MTKLASAVAAIAFLIPVAAHADLMTITVSFGGLPGVGSFNTDGTCSACTSSDGLSNFSFSLLGDAFALERMTFFRATGSLSGSLAATNQRMVFTPSGQIQLQSKERGRTVVLHGGYSISGDAQAEAPPLVDDAAPPTMNDGAAPDISAVPEPGAWLLLGTVITSIAVARRVRRRSGATARLPR